MPHGIARCGERTKAVPKLNGSRVAPRPRAQDLDRHIGVRLRDRRIMLGLTQQQLADMIGVTYQQAHKYEKGINRIAGGRLYTIAQALGVEVGFFYEDMDAQREAAKPTPQQRLLLELARNFVAISDRRQQEALCNLARVLASGDVAVSGESDRHADGEMVRVA
jgi:transcriptional regulator with XRE-family HTH domain